MEKAHTDGRYSNKGKRSLLPSALTHLVLVVSEAQMKKGRGSPGREGEDGKQRARKKNEERVMGAFGHAGGRGRGKSLTEAFFYLSVGYREGSCSYRQKRPSWSSSKRSRDG